MTDVPKIVKERLKIVAAEGAHPDANLLTAFSEQSLPDSERSFVLRHLARCGECREIVTLALPEDASVPALTPARSGGWFAWPTLRWAFVAAGIVVIASLGTVEYRQHERASTMAYKAAATSVAVKEAENQPISAPTAPPPQSQAPEASAKTVPPSFPKQGKAEPMNVREPSTRTLPRLGPAPGTTAAGIARGGPLAHGPRMLNQLQQQNANIQQQNAKSSLPQSSAPLPLPYAGSAGSQQARVAVSPDKLPATTAKSTPPAQDPTGLTVQSESVSQQPSTYEFANNVERAKPADDWHLSASRKVPAGAPAQFDRLSGRDASTPRWTISSSGALQRSYDQGNTWQEVNVSAAAAAPAAESIDLSGQKSGAVSNSKDKDIALEKKPALPVFRAVAANGPDVWAGGSFGTLYHSVDSGTHWNRIIPMFSGVTLTGDVIALDFPDLQHGKVTTSTSEVWMTSDAGQSWQKQ